MESVSKQESHLLLAGSATSRPTLQPSPIFHFTSATHGHNHYEYIHDRQGKPLACCLRGQGRCGTGRLLIQWRQARKLGFLATRHPPPGRSPSTLMPVAIATSPIPPRRAVCPLRL